MKRVSDDRSVSTPTHESAAESVWNIRMPALRVGRNATDELAVQLHELGVADDAHGLVVTDEGLVAAGHADRATAHLGDVGFDVDVYDESERDPSVGATEDCVSFVREAVGEDGYEFYVGLGGGSCVDTAKAARAAIADGGGPLDYVAEPTGAGESLERSGPARSLSAGPGLEDRLDGTVEEVGERERQLQARVVPRSFDRAYRLSRHADRLGQLRLGHVRPRPSRPQVVLHPLRRPPPDQLVQADPGDDHPEHERGEPLADGDGDAPDRDGGEQERGERERQPESELAGPARDVFCPLVDDHLVGPPPGPAVPEGARAEQRDAGGDRRPPFDRSARGAEPDVRDRDADRGGDDREESCRVHRLDVKHTFHLVVSPPHHGSGRPVGRRRVAQERQYSE